MTEGYHDSEEIADTPKKICRKCKEEKSLDEFRNSRQRKDGKSPYCRLCANAIANARYHQKKHLKHPENAARREAAIPDPSLTGREIKRCSRCFTWKVVEDFPLNAKNRDGRFSHCKLCMKAYKEKYYQTEAGKKKVREYQAKNAARIRQDNAVRYPKWAKENPDRINLHKKKWRNTHRSQCNAILSLYRAKMRTRSVEPVSNDRVLEIWGMTCHLCGKEINKGFLHFDHVIPIARGGPHLIENIRPAHWSCNCRKQDAIWPTVTAPPSFPLTPPGEIASFAISDRTGIEQYRKTEHPFVRLLFPIDDTVIGEQQFVTIVCRNEVSTLFTPPSDREVTRRGRRRKGGDSLTQVTKGALHDPLVLIDDQEGL